MTKLEDAFDLHTLTDALAATNVGVWAWDSTAEKVRWSPTMEEIFGLKPGSFEGTLEAYERLLHPEDREMLQQTIQHAMETKSRFRQEHRIVRPDGSVRWLEGGGEPVVDKSGKVTGMIGTAIDITERKESQAEALGLEEELRRRASELGTVLELVPVGVGVAFDPGCQRVQVNPAMADILGISVDENASLSAPPDQMPPFRMRKDGKDVPADELPMQLAAAKGVKVPAVEMDVVAADGSSKAVITQATPLFDEQGASRGSVLAMWDISERKHAEAQLGARLQQQAALATLGNLALSSDDPQDLMDEAVRLVVQVLSVEYCKVLDLLPGGDTLLLRAGVGWQQGLVGRATVGSGLDSQAGYTLKSEQPVIVDDLRTETRFRGPQLLHDHKVVSGLSVIIAGEDGPFGVLGAHTTQHRTFTDDDVHFLESVANLIALAVQGHDRDETIRRLSTPVLQIAPRALLVPVVGQMDRARAEQLENTLLYSIRDQRARLVVLDLTGAAVFNQQSIARLTEAASAARLLGAEVIMTGVSTRLANSFVRMGMNLTNIRMVGDLQSGIREALQRAAVASPAGTSA